MRENPRTSVQAGTSDPVFQGTSTPSRRPPAARRAPQRAATPEPDPQTLRTGIYVRLSQERKSDRPDPEEEDHGSIARQTKDTKAFAAVAGASTVTDYVDRDKSAWREDVVRPAFDRLREDIRAGRLDAVIVWKWDRLTRQHFQMEQIRREARKAGVRLVSVMEPDAGDASADITRRILSIVAEQQSNDTSMRVRRAHEENAGAGKHSGGGLRAWGYNDTRTEVIPEEAELVREAASRTLAGESTRSIVGDWQARGILTTTGKPWSPASLARTLRRPYLAGLREHRGEVVAEATWPPILERETWEATLRVLTMPERKTIESNARAYLLSGLLHCGVCGAKLVGRPWISPKGERRPRYICRKDPGRGSCGKVAQSATQLDEFIRDVIVRQLTKGSLLERMLRVAVERDDEAATLMESIRADEQQLQDLSDDYAAKAITRPQFLNATAKVTARLKDSQRRAAEASGVDFLATIPHDEPGLLGRWDNADLTWRRRLAFSVLERIEIAPKATRGNVFDSDRVRLSWRG